MNPIEKFLEEVQINIKHQGKDLKLKKISREWTEAAGTHNYTYNFSWLGRPIIQLPQDMVVMQELIWKVKPDLIIETGIAHGGSLIMNASLLAMLEYCDAIQNFKKIDPLKPKRKVLGIDIDIREHNKSAILSHPLSNHIEMIEGSSVEKTIIDEVTKRASKAKNVLVCLDSNHTHDHVLNELEAYAPLVSVGSYCVVFDTLIEDLPNSTFSDRPWGRGDNPKTAVWDYLKKLGECPRKCAKGNNLNFEIEHNIEDKVLITAAPDGFLRRV